MTSKVLIVEDSVDILEMLVSIIRFETDYEVKAAPSAAVALEIMRDWHPDVILTDLMMPGISGLDLISRVAEVIGPPRPKIIAISGFPALESEARARGASDFQLKPIDTGEILSLLDVDQEAARSLRDSRARAIERRRAASARAERALEEALAARPGFPANLDRVVGVLSRYFGEVCVAVVMLRNGEPEILASSAALCGRGPVTHRLLQLSIDVIETGSALVIADLRDLPFFTRTEDGSSLQFLVASPVALPSGPAVGALLMVDRRPHPFDALDLAILQHVARTGTEVLRGTPPPVFLTFGGFLIPSVWRNWLAAELARVGEEGLSMAMVETQRADWDPKEAEALMESLRPRAAIAEQEPRTMYVYQVGKDRQGGLDQILRTIDEHMGIAYAAVLEVEGLELTQRSEGVLDLLSAVLDGARRRSPGARLRTVVRPELFQAGSAKKVSSANATSSGRSTGKQ